MTAPAKKKAILKNFSFKNSKSIIDEIQGRQTEELVIGLCGAVGSGTSTIATKIKSCFNKYEYDTEIINISTLIKKHIPIVMEELKKDEFLNNTYISKIDLDSDLDTLDGGDRIALLQSAGNNLRKKESKDILSQLAIKEIALNRVIEDDEKKRNSGDDRTSKRHVTIIDSLKNPKEVELLQLVYRDMFYLFGVLCPEDIRTDRLKQKRIEPTKVLQLVIRDKSEGEKSGQQFLKTILHSDFFITNDIANVDHLDGRIDRFVKIILGDTAITPTIQENAMFHAQSAAAKSGCLSKQVGAAIIDKSGKLLSTGYNDVPKGGGGLYTTEDGKNDNRCMFKYAGKCINQDRKYEIFKDIDRILNQCLNGNGSSSKIKEISDAIRNHERLKNLIEYCRAIHAEMDAITSAARNGAVSLKNASMFVTTFPCHNCARHIVATGIVKVYYIEPYEKSLASDLHSDSISFDTVDKKNFDSDKSDNDSKVKFIPFEGVSPKKYLKLFLANDRKTDGARVTFNGRKSKPRIQVLLETRYEYESKVVELLEKRGFKE